MRACVSIASAVLLALTAACAGAAPTLTPTSPPTPTPTPTLAPTPTLTPTAANATPAAPLATGMLVNEPESFEGYTLYARDLVYLIDHAGRLVRAWEPRHNARLAKLLDNGNLLTTGNMEIDPDENIVWEYSRLHQHHDLLKLPNGNILFLSWDAISREELIALGANPTSPACPSLRATRIVEVRPTGQADGEIVWEWSALDHLVQDFDPEKANYGAVADHPERIDVNFNLVSGTCNDRGRNWFHANALDYNAELDQIMITVRDFSEIWIIDHSTSIEEAAGRTGGNAGKGGDLLYRWGNPRAYQRGTAADQRLFGPHNAHRIPDGLPGAGNILIFNNGWERPGFERGYSSVDEISLPADGHAYRLDEGAAYGPNEVVWRYAADPPKSFYAPSRSGAQRMPNGNTLITDGPGVRIFEVTREGENVWEFLHPAPALDALYRAYRYAPDHPGLRGLDLEPYRTAYRAALAGKPAARSLFDVYLTDGDLVYVKEACGQEDAERPFFLHIAPVRADDLQGERRRRGFNAISVEFFSNGGALFDGKCSMRVPLPDYPVAAVRTGQRNAEGGADLWSASFRLNSEPQRTAYRAALPSEPVARSAFNLYLLDDNLVYVREICGQTDTQPRFFLHIVPERVDDLPQDRREFGFDNLDFDFFLRGALFAGRCVATVPLPDYAIASIRTGQFGPQGELWSAEFAVE